MNPLTRLRSLGQPSASTIAGAGRFAEVRQVSSWLLWAIALVFVGLFGWSALAHVDMVSRADGRVIPSGKLQVVQNLEGGIVAAIHVKASELVEEGSPLVTLSATQFGAEVQARRQQLAALEARVARLMAQAEGKEPDFPVELRRSNPEFVANELAAFSGKKLEHLSQLTILDSQLSQKRKELEENEVILATARKALGLGREERQIIAMMVERGLEPRLELVRIDRSIGDAEGRAAQAEVSIGRLSDAIGEISARRETTVKQFRSEAFAEYNRTLADLRALQESLPALQDKVARTELRSPVKGIVNRVFATTVGGVVKPGDPIVEIVPADAQLVVEALVRPQDIGFIKIGQLARVKITAFDYAIYGALNGRVTQVGADAVPNERGEAFYQVRVETDANAIDSLGKKLNIIPGMQAQIDIITGNRTVLEYLSKPLIAVRENAFRER